MSEKRYLVQLTEDERSSLTALLKKKHFAARKRMRVRVLLKVDEGEHGPAWIDEQAAGAYDVHVNTVAAIRRRLVELGVEGAVYRKKQLRPSRMRTLNESAERELLAVAQSEPPEGRAKWTLHLLADKMVQLEIVDSISYETVRQALKKMTSSPTSRSAG